MKSLWIPFIISLAFGILLCFLGVWQLNKYFTKKEINSNNISSSSQLISIYEPSISKSDAIYNRFRLKGEFLRNKEIFAYKRFEGEQSKNKMFENCMIVMPLKLDDENIVMVARGLLEAQNCNRNYVEALNLDEIADLKVIALPSEERSSWTNFVDKKNNMWFFIDLKDIAQFIGEKIQTDYYFTVEQDYIGTNNQLGKIPFIATKRYQHHLWYAINWFSMLIVLLVMFVFYCKSAKLK
jgi:cytochrome oxidase assembly protein ShyY1